MIEKSNILPVFPRSAGTLLTTSIVSLLATGAALAVDWDGSQSTNWNDPLNWPGDVLPAGAAAGVQSVAGNIATISSNSAFNPCEVIIGGWFATGRLNHTAGTLTTQNVGWPPGWFLIGFGPQGNATYNLANTSTTGGTFTGFGTGTGSTNIVDALFVGEPGGSNDGVGVGTLNMNTTGNLSVAFDIHLGVSGWTGNMNLDAGAVTAGNLFVGKTANGNATAGKGNFKMSGGTVTLRDRLYLGLGDNVVATGSNIGTATLSGGTLRTDDLHDAYWAAGVSMASATWNGVTGSGQGGSGGTATFHLDGGVLSTMYVFSEARIDDKGTPDNTADDVVYAKGTSTFYFNGGTLQAQHNRDVPWAPFLGGGPGALGNPREPYLTAAYVQAGGAVIDSNGVNILVTQPLLADPVSTGGGFTKTGAGRLELAGQNTFTGPVVASAGELFVNPGNAPNERAFSHASSITINDGALLRASSNGLFGWDGTQEHPITVNAGGLLITSGLGVDVGVGVVTLAGGELASSGGSSNYGTWRFDNAGDSLVASQDSTVSATNVKFANGATINVAAGKTLTFTPFGTIDDAVIGGKSSVVKTGAGTLRFEGYNTYTGDTTINAGSVYMFWSFLPDVSTVRIASGATLELDTSADDTIGALIVNNTPMAPGLYRASNVNGGSGDGTVLPQLLGNGKLLVVTPPVSGYQTWANAHAGGASADLDSDGDGVFNGIEYFMNAPAGITLNPQLGGDHSITWSNGGNIPASAYGTEFVVQTSIDLVNWTNVPIGSLAVNTNTTLTYYLTGQGPRFVRLKVTPN
ncbi:autotransporter-associated beta strand repeat-containing protein [Luteolibacter soli]|uniref:Autotransporter-associated beta strand repeat-containing protein n=1 Tax=Luteolibacter soli TaxID=3135280 RepID=A0ABU9AXK0_9BACT